MPVSFPLDKIPALPAQAVALLVDQINVFINKIQSEIEATISEAAKLPDDVGCDYPPIQDLLARIKNIQNIVAGKSGLRALSRQRGRLPQSDLPQ